ncbi:phospholipase C type enzyme [Tilletia horrida]|uniref:Phospholipase C type enzyme n=1 Tax=Tilletia horrida TaxID=155126 RepID=A0AAN6GVP6_9BASI|nr:phospholipase C type enzyme [Tilletia horrida]KAK0555155.1 phospholipase C type enzyme [Tilletia horrida]KAK0568425.1 phospholipase C type enzyme [Tilletia horrida]
MEDSNGSTTASGPHANAERTLRVLTLNVWGLKFVSKLRVLRLRAIADRLGSVPPTPLPPGFSSHDGHSSSSGTHARNQPSTSSTAYDGPDHDEDDAEVGRSTQDYEDAYDVIALQEIWVESEDWRYMRSRCEQRYPYSKFFYSAAVGSGLAIMSRFPIVSTHTQPYLLNGVPIYVSHGDWIAGKAFGSITIQHPRAGLIDIYNTHTIAAGGEDGPESKRAHRVAQAWELATKVRDSAERGRHAIVMGDINSTPPSLTIAVLRDVGGLQDAFLASHPSLPAHAVSLPPSANNNGPVDPERALAELGVTCDSPLNTWTAGKPLDPRARAGAGKRLDYVFWRGPNDPLSRPYGLLSSSSKSGQDGDGGPVHHDPRGRLRCTQSAVVFTERLTHRPDISFSDHFGVSATFTILDEGSTATVESTPEYTNGALSSPSPAGVKSTGAGLSPELQRNRDDSRTLQTLTSALQALSGAANAARQLQHTHYLAFLGSLGLAFLLVILAGIVPTAGKNRTGSATQGGVHALFVVLAVAAGWAGTTMLYSAFIGGEWEKRSLRTIMESIELELSLVKKRLNESEARTSGNARTPGVNTGTSSTLPSGASAGAAASRTQRDGSQSSSKPGAGPLGGQSTQPVESLI